MEKRIISEKAILEYVTWLKKEEKSRATIAKYEKDVKAFCEHVREKILEKEDVITYKNWLIKQGYAMSSINSKIAALNSFFDFMGWCDYRLKSMRIQRQIYCPESKELTKEEYKRLVLTAENNGNTRMALILQTICCTGIRVSELSYITVEAVSNGEAIVWCKGKMRKIFIITNLRKKLCDYIRENRLLHGPVFVTNSGNPMNRTNIWREMKNLCEKAEVNPTKVTPHNLRHLFARTFYSVDKDLAKLADILGHSSINTTRIYIITTENEHRQCMEKLHLII